MVGSIMVAYGRELVGLVVIFAGIGVFLYGSNLYNAAAGWAGLVLLIGGIVAEIVFEVLGYLRKNGS